MSDTNLESWIAKTQKLIKLDYEEELEQNRYEFLHFCIHLSSNFFNSIEFNVKSIR